MTGTDTTGGLWRHLRRGGGLLREHGLWLTALLSVGVFAGLFLLADAEAVTRSLLSVDGWTLVTVLALVVVSYAVRFLKWGFYLRELDIDVPLGSSLLTFFSGLMLVVTPGKLGEVWKAWFLRDREGIPASRTTAVVGAERITDLLALSALAVLGVVVYRRSPAVLLAVGGTFLAGLALLQWRTACLAVLDRLATLPVVGPHAASLESFYEGTYALFRPRPLAVAMVLSVLAWGLEGAALWVILAGLGADASLVVGLFVFGLGSVVGAVSLLPGGLAATEASMVGLLVALGVARTVAVSSTLLVRVGTLWFGAALGTAVFGLSRLSGRADR
ncbi:lysylphosphatidylglycerol synthase transmembrane domain-containing protein [Halomarina litorea]|uniref:lysylphosphatidylglycerol synthase transmembrane domain-containing protein n=1 Tax=Halomarina litorea TaxID=2961595 RepID=UPI0020C464B7|nr:lysylphosphatidylglycerol synthase transmembrane domain-containing protein [Halomarina sp. BCD28]